MCLQGYPDTCKWGLNYSLGKGSDVCKEEWANIQTKPNQLQESQTVGEETGDHKKACIRRISSSWY